MEQPCRKAILKVSISVKKRKDKKKKKDIPFFGEKNAVSQESWEVEENYLDEILKWTRLDFVFNEIFQDLCDILKKNLGKNVLARNIFRFL